MYEKLDLTMNGTDLRPLGIFRGTHGSELHEDNTGAKWLVKRQDLFRTLLDHAISRIQHATPYYSNRPRVEIANIGGEVSAAHQYLPGTDAFGRSFVIDSRLTRNAGHFVGSLANEHAFDWLISNHDSHAGQFIVLGDGTTLIGIDKGQAFKHFGEDRLDPTYHPNAAYGERPPIYNGLVNAGIPMPAWESLDGPHQLMAIPDDAFAGYLRPYSVAASRAKRLALGSQHPNDPDAFVAGVLARRARLLDDLATFPYVHAG